MVLSFGGVLMIALGQANDDKEKIKDQEEERELFLSDNKTLAAIFGCSMCLLIAVANGSIAVFTRMMQSVRVAVLMFYLAVLSLILLSTILLIENAVTGGPIRILNYSAEQYMFGFGSGAISTLSLLFKTIAF